MKSLTLYRRLAVILLFPASWPGSLLAGDAPSNDPAASYARGLQFLKGDGQEKNPDTAFHLMEEAAKGGYPNALAAMGYFYAAGVVVTRDDARARDYFEQAAAKGSLEGEVNLGKFLIGGRGGDADVKRGVALLEKAGDQGSNTARCVLGEVYYFGEHAGGQPDYHRAYEVLLPAAEAGNADARNIVGVLFRDGRLGTADPAKAREWFEKAAMQKDGKACSNLGHLLGYNAAERGTRVEAVKWLILARDLKETTATFTLIEQEKSIAPDEMAEAQKLAGEVSRKWASH